MSRSQQCIAERTAEGTTRRRWRRTRTPRWVAVACLSLAVGQPDAVAVDRAFVEVGAGHEGDLVRVGVQWDHDRKWLEGGRWHLGLSLELEAGTWRPEVGRDPLYEFGFTPVLRLMSNRSGSSGPVPFFEAGLGVHLLSNVHFSDLDLSTSLQFGSHIGAGVFLGRDRRWSLVYRFQHLSNSSVKLPNPGIEFHLLQLGCRFGAPR